MIVVKTENGSLYELDLEGRRVRRIEGLRPIEEATSRLGKEGAFKAFENCSKPTVGASLVVVWRTDVADGLPVMRSTITSPISELRHLPQA